MHTFDDSVYWHGYSDAAQVIGGFAAGISLCIAAFAAVLVIIQTKASRKISKEAAALEVHREYLKLCVERPELSSSEALSMHLDVSSLSGIGRSPISIEAERGLWFLSYVLHTSEQIIETTHGDPAWVSLARSQIEYHRDTIREVWPLWRKHYGNKLARLVEQVIDAA